MTHVSRYLKRILPKTSCLPCPPPRGLSPCIYLCPSHTRWLNKPLPCPPPRGLSPCIYLCPSHTRWLNKPLPCPPPRGLVVLPMNSHLRWRSPGFQTFAILNIDMDVGAKGKFRWFACYKGRDSDGVSRGVGGVCKALSCPLGSWVTSHYIIGAHCRWVTTRRIACAPWMGCSSMLHTCIGPQLVPQASFLFWEFLKLKEVKSIAITRAWFHFMSRLIMIKNH